VSKDYKKAEHNNSGSRGGGGSLLVGILIGLVLGLSIALGVAWYINKMPSPFTRLTPPAKAPSKAESRDGTKAGEKSATAAPEGKPRFDFYKILPGYEQPATDQQFKDAQQGSTGGEKETFFLQAGAFQSAPDADNLKARLALIGVEATIQTATLPEKGVCHRVRIGPYSSIEELNRTRDTLKQNGYDTTLIKVQEAPQPR
jgi:cell division protein FtsN